METEKKEYWLDRHRFLAIAIILLIMWSGFMVFYYLKAEEITTDPCGVCARKYDYPVILQSKGTIPVTRVFYPNGSQEDIKPDLEPYYKKSKNVIDYEFNFSSIKVIK